MSVTTRKWKTKDDTEHRAYVVRYSLNERDERGRRKRAIKTFDKKKDAEEFEATVRVDVLNGVHVPRRSKLTVKEAGDKWAEHVESEGRERTTVDSYKEHFKLHINPRIG